MINNHKALCTTPQNAFNKIVYQIIMKLTIKITTVIL